MAQNPMPDKPVGALINGLAILRYLADSNEPVGVTKVAKDLQLNPSTCFNLLKTLVHEDLVDFDATTKAYSVGMGIIELAKNVLEHHSYVKLIRPHLKEIASRFSVTATLWQRIKGERVVLMDLANSDATIRVQMSIGQRLPMYVAAMGRCFAAEYQMKAGEVQKKILSLRWENPPKLQNYMADIERVRQSRFAVDIDHHVKGVTTVSSIVMNQQHRPVLAISAVGFSAQLDKTHIEDLGHFIKSKIFKISKIIQDQNILIDT